MARRWLRDDNLAEDIVQEIFIQIWKSAERYDPDLSSERTWIATIARRRLIDVRRKQGSALPLQELQTDAIGLEDAGEAAAILDEEARAARGALSRLAPEQQRMVSLSVLDGLSHSQIAEHTGLPLGTVKTHVRSGLARLRGLLGAAGPRGGKGVRS